MPIDFEDIDHVAIRVKALEASAQWYEKILALSVVHRWANAWLLQRGKARLGLYSAPDAIAVDEPEHRLCLHHFAFRVTPEQMIAAEVFLQSVELPYDGPKDSGFFWSLFVTDPDGYRVELIADHAVHGA